MKEDPAARNTVQEGLQVLSCNSYNGKCMLLILFTVMLSWLSSLFSGGTIIQHDYSVKHDYSGLNVLMPPGNISEDVIRGFKAEGSKQPSYFSKYVLDDVGKRKGKPQFLPREAPTAVRRAAMSSFGVREIAMAPGLKHLANWKIKAIGRVQRETSDLFDVYLSEALLLKVMEGDVQDLTLEQVYGGSCETERALLRSANIFDVLLKNLWGTEEEGTMHDLVFDLLEREAVLPHIGIELIPKVMQRLHLRCKAFRDGSTVDMPSVAMVLVEPRIAGIARDLKFFRDKNDKKRDCVDGVFEEEVERPRKTQRDDSQANKDNGRGTSAVADFWGGCYRHFNTLYNRGKPFGCDGYICARINIHPLGCDRRKYGCKLVHEKPDTDGGEDWHAGMFWADCVPGR